MLCSQPGPAVLVTVPIYTPPTPNPPGAPTVSTPVVTGSSSATCTVSWNMVPGATYYRIFVNGNFAAQASTPPVTLDVGAYVGQTISVSVAACN